jgi:Flp pilus assembly pilin Flp
MFRRSRQTRRGAGAVEYGLVIALVAAGTLIAVQQTGGSIAGLLSGAAERLNGVNSAVRTAPDPDALYDFTSHTFSTCGANGRYGPSLSACRNAYATDWDEDPAHYDMSTQGIQEWVVPETGAYRITAAGAQGGDSGGRGARVAATVSLTAGDRLLLAIGQQGSRNNACGTYGGGGGGSYVALGTSHTSANPLLVAAGGNGRNSGYLGPGGSANQGSDGRGLTSGNGKGACGGGFYTSGACGNSSQQYGRGFRQGAVGGGDFGSFPADGGFGGGSGTYCNGSGAGGGYDGGSGMDGPSSAPSGVAARSFIAPTATSPARATATNSGDGYVTVEKLP